MDRYDNSLDRFLGLMAEEHIVENRDESPHEFLLNLWRTDKNSFFYVIRGSLKYMRSTRGMDSCIINVCMTIGQETRELIEAIALRHRNGSKWSDGFIVAAILLGSTQALNKFKKGFEESFAAGVRYYYSYKRVELLDYLKTTIFLKLTSMSDLVAKLASMKNEQNHRLNEPLLCAIFSRLTAESREQRLSRIDNESIKYAEAANVYFMEGADGIKKYVETKGNSEYRVGAYLFCLACERNPNDLDFFMQQYALYKDPMLKNMCIESIIYIGDSDRTGIFLDEELGKYNLNLLVKKRGHDFKIITFKAHDRLFYYLLDACYYLKTINESLISKLNILVDAQEAATSTPAMLILKKHGIVTFNDKRIDASKALLLKTLPSPAHLLSMARSSGRL